MKRSRVLIPAVIAATLVLTGCSAGGSGATKDVDGTECIASGPASEAVTVEGKDSGDLKLTSKTPIEVTETERTVLTEGKGDLVEADGAINMALTYFNGTTGEIIEQVPATPVTNSKEQLNEWAYEAVRCATPGQRVAMVMPFETVFPGTPEEAGMTAEDPFIVVADFSEATEPVADPAACDISAFEPDTLLTKAEGKAEKAPKGFPTVKLAEDGAPTITMPKGAAPDELEVATLIKGDGAEVKPGDCVAVNYRGVIWETGEEFDSSWSRGQATAFPTDGVIGGFQKALEGQKVGSQIISVVPAEDGGYGAEGLTQMGHKEDAVMVFVLDIVGVK